VNVDQSHLRTGSIVWATLRDRNGFRKRRPAIVLTPSDEISHDQPIVVMAVTTTFPSPAPRNCLELPWNSDRRKVSTGLAQRSAAVLTWLDTVYIDEIDGFIGSVPSSRMREIQRRLTESED
jgi:mRNA-degrading endonuclease toxin of MazEF toxin-antitoxin module